MLQSEFVERTGYMPTWDEYKAIEELYYRFDGNKDDFCANFKAHKKNVMIQVREIACASFVKEREHLLNQMHAAEREAYSIGSTKDMEYQYAERKWNAEKAKYEARIKTLEQQVDKYSRQRNEYENSCRETAERLQQALRDIQALKDAIRLLKA